MQHYKNRTGFYAIFLFAWVVALVSFLLGISGKIALGVSVAVFLACLVCGALAIAAALVVVKCAGCGKLIFNFRVDAEGEPEKAWRCFTCKNCGDSTFVKGSVRWGEPD
jgi:DNA-directed RNA polymerase subunit RPC12/RpoP